MMSAVDHVTLLAGQAVAAAEGYLCGRQDALQLKVHAEKLQLELAAISDPSAHMLLDFVRFLGIAMLRLSANALALEAAVDIDSDNEKARPLADNAGILAARGMRWREHTMGLVVSVRKENQLLAERMKLQREALAEVAR